MITVRVPATTANLGSGFDSVGVALTMYNQVSFSVSDRLDICSEDGVEVPRDERNLVYIAAKRLFAECGKEVPALKIRQRSVIPMARGLGSSSACIVAGLVGANALLGNVYETAALADIAAAIEGHPDNVLPALLGGAVVSAMGAGHVSSGKITVPADIAFAAFVPDFPLETAKARAALPKSVPMASAVYNLGRSGLLTYALINGRYDMLRVATDDRLHTPYRLPLIPGGAQIIEAAYAAGAYAAFISGSGSTIMALYPADDLNFEKRMDIFMNSDARASRFRMYILYADNVGATVVRCEKEAL